MNAGEDKESGKLANACKVNRSVAPNKVQTGNKATTVVLIYGATSAAYSNGVDDTQCIPTLI